MNNLDTLKAAADVGAKAAAGYVNGLLDELQRWGIIDIKFKAPDWLSLYLSDVSRIAKPISEAPAPKQDKKSSAVEIAKDYQNWLVDECIARGVMDEWGKSDNNIIHNYFGQEKFARIAKPISTEPAATSKPKDKPTSAVEIAKIMDEIREQIDNPYLRGWTHFRSFAAAVKHGPKETNQALKTLVQLGEFEVQGKGAGSQYRRKSTNDEVK